MNKQQDLSRVVDIIREHCPTVGMIILFGSYARGGWKESKDLAADRKSGHVSDYDILAISEEERECDSLAWQEIAKACSGAGLSATPRFIHHDIRFVNRKLEVGQYFFSDILAEGKMLYDSGEFTLAEPRPLSPKERLEIANRDYKHWFTRATEFNKVAGMTVKEGMLEVTAFNLHQAAESCYKTMLLVFTGYIPDEHYLAILGSKVEAIDPGFTDIFPSEDKFQRDAFTALEYAYIGARYDSRYTIDKASLTWLAERIEQMLDLTRERCLTKIASLEQTGKN